MIQYFVLYLTFSQQYLLKAYILQQLRSTSMNIADCNHISLKCAMTCACIKPVAYRYNTSQKVIEGTKRYEWIGQDCKAIVLLRPHLDTALKKIDLEQVLHYSS